MQICCYVARQLRSTGCACTAVIRPVRHFGFGNLACAIHVGSAGAVRGGLSFNPAKYPFVYRNETIKDVLFGVEVPDPYRWLEDGNSSATKACKAH